MTNNDINSLLSMSFDDFKAELQNTKIADLIVMKDVLLTTINHMEYQSDLTEKMNKIKLIEEILEGLE